MLTLLTALLLTLLTTYSRFGGWRYTLFVSTNQNHCYMPKLNDMYITTIFASSLCDLYITTIFASSLQHCIDSHLSCWSIAVALLVVWYAVLCCSFSSLFRLDWVHMVPYSTRIVFHLGRGKDGRFWWRKAVVAFVFLHT